MTWREVKVKTVIMQVEDGVHKWDSNSETEKDHCEEEQSLHLTWLWGVKSGKGNTQISQSQLGDGESDMRKTGEAKRMCC